MSSRESMPSLADLRRKSRPKTEVRPKTPGLFDFLPEVDELAAEPHHSPTVELNVQQFPTGDPGIDEQLESTKRHQQVTDPRVWTVGELVQQVRGVLERSYAQIIVEGEISNWRPAATGHCYFTLKDGAAQLSVVMFRRQASLVRFQPKDGDAVRLRGQLSVFESRGQMQLVAEWMELRGLGALLAAVRELRERLRREGLFDHKRPLPSFPKCIGVVTSEHGAALRDIVKVCRRRHAAVNLLIYPAAVQGPRCAIEVAAGVRWFSRNPDRADVVLVARGGGSWEDLHGFDDERVARAIAACTVPVIVGVGHATDSTIADAAADVSAPTPSAAAEIVTAAHHRVEERVDRLHSRLIRAGRFEVLRARQSLSHLGAEMVFRRVRDALDRRAQRCDEFDLRLHNVLSRRIRTAGDHSFRLETRLLRRDPAARLRDNGRELENLHGRLSAISLAIASHRGTQLDRAVSKLQALSPVRVLERGYALVYGPSGKLLSASTEIQPGEQITARLHRGSLAATVTEKK